MKFASKFLLAKIQPTAGTDPDPDGSNSIETSDLTFNPYGGPTADFNQDRLTLGASKQINTSPENTASFNVQFSGSGTVGTPPAYGPLLRACGLSETIDAGVSVTYAPVSTGFEMVALYVMRVISSTVQFRHPMLDVKGNVTINATARELPQFQFDNFTGLYVRPTRQTTLITPDLSSFNDALPFTKGNTPTFTWDSHSFCVNAFSFNLGNVISRTDEPGCQETNIEDRDPSGSITVKATDPDTKDVYALIESHLGENLTAVSLQHGTTAGNIMTISLPKIQPRGISEQNVNGELYYQIDFAALPDSGDDEFELALT